MIQKISTSTKHILIFLFAIYLSGKSYAQEVTWQNCSSAEGVPTLKCLEIIFGNLITASNGLIVLILFVMFVTGSMRYLMSGGNPEQLKKAQGTIKYAIIGLVLFVSAYLILKVIGYLFLGGNASRLLEFKIGE